MRGGRACAISNRTHAQFGQLLHKVGRVCYSTPMPSRPPRRHRPRPRAVVVCIAVALAIAGALSLFFSIAPSEAALRSVTSASARDGAPGDRHRPARARPIDVEQERADRAGAPATEIARANPRGKSPCAGGVEGDLCAFAGAADASAHERRAAAEAAKRCAPVATTFLASSFERERPRARGPPSDA